MVCDCVYDDVYLGSGFWIRSIICGGIMCVRDYISNFYSVCAKKTRKRSSKRLCEIFEREREREGERERMSKDDAHEIDVDKDDKDDEWSVVDSASSIPKEDETEISRRSRSTYVFVLF